MKRVTKLALIAFTAFQYSMSYASVFTKHLGYLDVGVQEDMSCAVVNFFTDIAKKEDLQLRLIPSPLQTASEKIYHNEIDVSAHGISNTNTQARPDYAVASAPYLDVQRGFTVLKNSPFAKMTKLPKGSKVAVMDESTALQDIKHKYKDDFKLTIVSKLEGKARELLRQHKVDAIAEGYTGFWFNPDDAKDLTMIDVHSLDENDPNAEGLAFWVQVDEPELLDIINREVTTIKSSHYKLENIYRFYQDNGTCDTHYAFPNERG